MNEAAAKRITAERVLTMVSTLSKRGLNFIMSGGGQESVVQSTFSPSNAMDLVIDVDGYFAPPANDAYLPMGKILFQIVFSVWVTLTEQKWVTFA